MSDFVYKEIPKPRTKEQTRKDLANEYDDTSGKDFEEHVEMVYKYEQARYKELVKEQHEQGMKV